MRLRHDLNPNQIAFYEPMADLRGVAIPHRGGDGANSEGIDKQNTVAAFCSAAQTLSRYGLPPYAEIDLSVTEDGEIVVIHGSGTPRQRFATTPEIPTRREISHMTLSEVQKFVRVGNEPVPTFNQALEAVPGMKFFVDPKNDSTAKVLIKYLLNNPAALERVCVGSFSERRNQMFAEVMGDKRPAMTLALGGAATLLRLLSRGDTEVVSNFIGQSYASSATALQYFRHMRGGEYLDQIREQLPVFGHVWLPSKLTREHALRLTSCYDGIMANQTEIIAEVVASHNSGTNISE